MSIDIRNPWEYCENFLKILDKRKQLVPLRFKPAQVRLYEIIKEEHDAGRPVRLIVLKGRQLGTSTEIEGLYFADTVTRSNVYTLIIAHEEQATSHLFEMKKIFFDNLPDVLKPMRKASNAQELVFENPTKDPLEKERLPGLRSRIRCVTAGGRGVGRSFTLTNVHGSEVAFWPKVEELLLGLMQAVPNDPDTCVILETTANGYNEFKDLWDKAVRGENGYKPVFLPWYWDPDYAMEPPERVQWTDEEERLAEVHGLTEAQLWWRRWCIKTNCGGSERLFRQEYPNTPDEAFLLSGTPYFDNLTLAELRQTLPEPEHIGYFEHDRADDGKPINIRWIDDEVNGFIRIWKEPEKGHPYVIGGDTAGEGSDCFTGICIDNTTGVQAAELQHETSERLYAAQMYCLGMYYNRALVGVEVNFSTYPEMMLEDWGYPRLYQRKRLDKVTRQLVPGSFGWHTDRKTRPVILANLQAIMDETPEVVQSKWLVGEMLTFAKNGDRPEALEGEHDDLVMAEAITYGIRDQQSYLVMEEPEERHEKLIVKIEKQQRRRRR
ncbi:MAG: hypothetical protein IJV64_00820 [Oscillospiraceae bacterium]|nr:hypothetical protein [Oscillospiraceae bacterium]